MAISLIITDYVKIVSSSCKWVCSKYNRYLNFWFLYINTQHQHRDCTLYARAASWRITHLSPSALSSTLFLLWIISILLLRQKKIIVPITVQSLYAHYAYILIKVCEFVNQLQIPNFFNSSSSHKKKNVSIFKQMQYAEREKNGDLPWTTNVCWMCKPPLSPQERWGTSGLQKKKLSSSPPPRPSACALKNNDFFFPSIFPILVKFHAIHTKPTERKSIVRDRGNRESVIERVAHERVRARVCARVCMHGGEARKRLRGRDSRQGQTLLTQRWLCCCRCRVPLLPTLFPTLRCR